MAHACTLLGKDVILAHAKDRDAQGRFVAAGRGVLDYDHYIAQLRAINYNGPLILHTLSADEVDSCVELPARQIVAPLGEPPAARHG